MSEPVEAAPAPVPESAPAPAPAPIGRRALLFAVAMIVAVVLALVGDGPSRYLLATVLAVLADVLSVVAIVLGIVAIVRDRQRGAGVAALVVAVLGNPLVLLYGLGLLT